MPERLQSSSLGRVVANLPFRPMSNPTSQLAALHAEDATRLIAVVTSLDPTPDDLEARRLEVVAALGEIIDADAGHWAWGRGAPDTNSIAPVAMVEFGYTNEQQARMIEHAMNPESMKMFQARMTNRFDGQRLASATRRDLIPDDEWRHSPLWCEYVERLGLDSWVHAVRYSGGDTWSCLHMLRRRAKLEFEARHAALLHAALASIAWLSSTAAEMVPTDVFKPLTPRQRTVMLLVLDGRSRKDIARQLGLSEHTIDDHLKAIYAHFGVRSVGELAARFLKRA